MKDVMLDLETLGTRHDALIMQIGACRFDRNTGEIGETFLRNVDAGEYHDRFTTDHETIQWWLDQTYEAQQLLVQTNASGSGKADIVPLKEALVELGWFLRGDGVLVWSHSTFDMPVIKNAFEVCGIRWPIPFRNARDIRTLMDLSDYRSIRFREGVHHNALDDAKHQVVCVSDALKQLYGERE